jgi:hypothetical protein
MHIGYNSIILINISENNMKNPASEDPYKRKPTNKKAGQIAC